MSKRNETTPNVPTLRFKEFSGEWKKIRLGSIIEEIKTYTSDFNKYPLYSFTIENGVTPKTDRYERNFLVTKDGDTFKIVPPNSFVMNPMNLRFGAINYSKVKIPVSVSGYYNIFEIENGKNNEFWSAYFLTKTAINLYNSVATGSLIEKKRVHFSQFIQLSFYVPSDIEKQKITRFLQLIENRIAVQNKIISKYETLIKGLYTQIQSKSVKKEYRICDIVKCHSVGLLSKENLTESGSKKCILYGELFTTYDEVINEIKSRTNVDGYISQGNEILFPSSTTVDAMSLIAPSALNEKGILLGGDMFVLELLPGFNNEYISYYLNTIAKRNLAKYAQGTTITHLYFEHIKNVLLYLPDITIQLSVASKMRKLKTKIQIEKEMLSALQKQKAFLLQSMFI